MHFTDIISHNFEDWNLFNKMQLETGMFWVIPLSLSGLLVHLMVVGSLFHSVVATCLKDLTVNVVCLTVGILSKTHMLWDFMFSLFCSLTEISSCRYLGAELLMHLWVNVRILNSIHCHMGSQCSAFSDSVELSYFDFPRTNSCTHFIVQMWHA